MYFKSRLAQNITAMYGSQIASYLFPLATIPYLARVLGPYHLGMVAVGQALGFYFLMIMEFGFQLSATRLVARAPDDTEYLAGTAAGVLGAKVLLGAACLAVTPVLQIAIESFRGQPLILWAGAFAGISNGFSMLWFFQGIERLKIPAGLEMLAKACAAAGVFLLVRTPADDWRVLALQCVCNSGYSVALLVMLYKRVPFRIPGRTAVVNVLRDSAPMFLFRSAASLYSIANAVLLGAVAGPVAVGLYTGVDRPIRALMSLINPVSQSIYPRLNKLLTSDRTKAVQLVRISFAALVLGGTACCVAVLLAAPMIVRVLLGPDFLASVPVMRILSLLLPVIAASHILGIQWMLPHGMDRVFNKIILSGGLLNLTLGLWWAARWQQTGMACAVVLVEAWICFAMWMVLNRRKMNPFAAPGSDALPCGLSNAVIFKR